MNALLLSSYSFDAAALPFLLAGLLAFGIGTGLLLYERFTPASRQFFYPRPPRDRSDPAEPRSNVATRP